MEWDEYPEEILSVKWGTSPQQNEFLSEEYIQHNSAAYKILNDTFTKVWSSDSDDDTKKKQCVTQKPNQKIVRRLFRLYKPFSAYPRLSNLTINEHKVYLQLMKKFSITFFPHITKQDQEDFQLYQKLQKKVASEQMEYLDFLRNFALSNPSRYSSIHPDIKKYIDELWKMKLKNPMKYPRYYRPYRTIGLVLNDSKEPLDLVPHDEILKRGRINVLNLERRQKIDNDYSNFVKRNPIIDEAIANKDTITTFNCPVSQDQNAEVIAEWMDVDFVLSSSSLKRICDNYPPFNKSWEIPVVVKELDVGAKGHTVKKRVIFIDKALPRRKMTVVDKLILFYKVAVKHFLVRFKTSYRDKGGSYKDKLSESGGQEEDFLQTNWSDFNDLETFGVDGPNCSKSPVEKPVSSMESLQSNEGTVSPKDDCGENPNPVKNNELNQENHNDETGSSCMSDSDDDQLVIDDPEANETTSKKKSENILEPCSKMSKKSSTKRKSEVENNASVEECPKPQTRSMAKMLENLSKVEKIANMKNNLRRNTLSTTNVQLSTLSHSETVENIPSSKEEVNSGQSDNKTSGEEKDLKGKTRAQSLLDELLEQQKRWYEHERPKSNQNHSELVDAAEKKLFFSHYKPIPPPKDSNYVYRLFSLKKKDLPVQGSRLLIRCKIDAREAPPKHTIATIVPKLEFQPEFGAEVVTVSEMIQDWLSVRIRPNSHLLRARINAFTSDVLMVEEKEYKDFYKDEKYHSVQASSCLNTLEAVLRAFRDLPTGQYIFTHEPKMGAFGNVYIATNDTSGGLFDLHEQYNVDTTVEEPQVLSNHWVPLDFSIITPLQEQLERIPGTFIPKNSKKPMKRNKKKKTDSPSTT